MHEFYIIIARALLCPSPVWPPVSYFIRLVVVASQMCKIPWNPLKIRTYTVQGHPRSILVSIESTYATSY